MLAIINYAELRCQAVRARFEITAVDWPCPPLPADALEQLNYKTKWYKIVTKQAVLCYLFAFHMLSFAPCLTSAKNF